MNIVVVVRQVPDLVEEINVDASGTALDTTWLRQIINEPDNHALEQAILLKERVGGTVTVLAPDGEGADDLLFAAAAKGADTLIKLTGEAAAGSNHGLARALAAEIGPLAPDLVLTGVQAHTDLDGAVGPLLAEHLAAPYVGYVAGLRLGDGGATVRKEHPGGLVAEMAVTLPAVLGIQAAEQPPRYVAVSKIRQAMSTARVEARAAATVAVAGGPAIARMYPPEAAGRATMLKGNEGEVAAQLVDVLRSLGVV